MLLLSPPPPPQQAGQGVRRALIVAVRGSGPKPLTGSHVDAYTMERILRNFLGFKEIDILMLVDKDDLNIQPTRNNILEKVHGLTRGAVSGDTFAFVYIGHGKRESEKEGQSEFLFYPSDSNLESNDGTIKARELRGPLVDDVPAGCNVLIIIDACAGGNVFSLSHTYFPVWQARSTERKPANIPLLKISRLSLKGHSLDNRNASPTFPTVIQLSPCLRSEENFESDYGGTMASALQKLFRAATEKGPPTYRSILTQMSGDFYKHNQHHNLSLQHPQLSSHTKLDLNQPFIFYQPGEAKAKL